MMNELRVKKGLSFLVRCFIFLAFCTLWSLSSTTGCKWGLRDHECHSANDCADKTICRNGRCLQIEKTSSEVHHVDETSVDVEGSGEKDRNPEREAEGEKRDESCAGSECRSSEKVFGDASEPVESEPVVEQTPEPKVSCDRSQPTCLFAVGAGGGNEDRAEAMAINKHGEIYIAGIFSGFATFGKTTLTSRSAPDMFVAKMDAKGTFLWAKQIGDVHTEFIHELVLDKDGNVYIAGRFHTKTTFDTVLHTSKGKFDAFVAKMNPKGAIQWVSLIQGSFPLYAGSLAVDKTGHVYVGGYIRGAVSFGGTLQLGHKYNYFDDLFIAKLDNSGKFLWVKRVGKGQNDHIYDLALDKDGNVYATGIVREKVEFGTHSLDANGGWDVFVAKMNPSGTFLWAKRFGGVNDEFSRAIALDSEGGIYIAGNFSTLTVFGNTKLIAKGSSDIFVAKLDKEGNLLWAKQAGGAAKDIRYQTPLDFVRALLVDSSKNVYISGSFGNIAQFGDATLTAKKDPSETRFANDIFIAKLDTNGKWLWAQRAGGKNKGSNIESAFALAFDPRGDVFAAGTFSDSADFSKETLLSEGGTDIFVWKVPPKP